MRTGWLVLMAVTIAPVVLAAELPLAPFSYVEGFEGATPPLTLWASRGTPPTVNFLGASTEKASEGTKSLKIDVTFGDSTYYYYGLPLNVPVEGKLRISARLWVADANENNVGFGTNLNFPPTTHSGCAPIESYRKPTGEWKLVQADLVATGRQSAEGVMNTYARGVSGSDVGVVLDRWSLSLTGEPGKRGVAYLDDVRPEGEVPEGKAYLAQVQATFDASRAAFQKQLEAWEQKLETGKNAVSASATHAAEAPQLVEAIKQADDRSRAILARFRKDGYGSPAEMAELQRELGVLEHWPQALAALKQAKAAGRKFMVAPCNRPTLVARKGGNELMSVVTGDTALSLGACAGEYESASATVYALQDTPGLEVSCSVLKAGSNTLPADSVDIRILKSWYQGASTNIGYTKEKWLIPELLLKDDKLVRVDVEKQDNYVRSTATDGSETYLLCSDPDSSNLAAVRPMHAATLRAVHAPAGAARQCSVPVHVPEKTKAGLYKGALTFTSSAGTATLPVELTVQPFALEPSRLIYSIYYRGVLAADGQPTISSEGKSLEQYRAEMDDMKAHGVLYPTNYVGPKEADLRKLLDIRRELRMPTDHFYNLGFGVGQQTEEQLPAVQTQVKWWQDFLKPYGYKQVYFYGIDEATGETLARQKAVWKAVQQVGGKTFVACYKGTFEAMGDTLNTAVLAGPPDPDEAKKYHSIGSQAFCYANPQVGVEDPGV